MNPIFKPLSVQPLDVVLIAMKEVSFLFFFKNKSTHPSVCLSCFQRANRDSTSPHWEIWSVQNVRRIVSLTTRGRCSVAVKKTTSVLKETLWPWLVPVSVCFVFFVTDPLVKNIYYFWLRLMLKVGLMY